MIQVNVLEAKTDLSKLIRLLETKREDVIRVARNGKPVVEMTAIRDTAVSKRIGVAKNKFIAPEDLDEDNDIIAGMLTGGDL